MESNGTSTVSFKLHDFIYDGMDCKMLVMKDKAESLNIDTLKMMNEAT
jgi:hypothetical protein